MSLTRLLLTTSLCLSAGLIVGEEPTVAEHRLFPHEQATDIPVDPAIRWGRLDNGLRYAVMTNHEPADKLTLRLFVPAGSLEETDAQRGWAHYLEHMAFNGSEHYPAGTGVETLQRLGIAFGSNLNAHTGFDQTVYKLDLPGTEAEVVDAGFLWMRDALGGLLITEEEVDSERGVILAEYRDRDDAGYRMALARYAATYPGTRIPHRMPIGIHETINSANSAGMREFYEAWYRAPDAVFVAVGALSLEELEARIQTTFGDLPGGAPAAKRTFNPVTPNTDWDLVLTNEPEAGSATIGLWMLQPEDDRVDTQATRLREGLGDAACELISRRLSTIANSDPEAPIVGGGAGNWPNFTNRHLVVQVMPKPGRELEAIDLMVAEYRRFLAHGPSAAEVMLVKGGAAAQLQQAAATAANRPNRALADGIWSSVNRNMVMVSPADELELSLPMIELIEAEGIRATLADYADIGAQGRRVISVQGLLSEGLTEDAILSRLAAAWDAPVPEAIEEEAATWAYGEPIESGAVAARHEVAHGIVQLIGANQAAVSILPRDERPNEVLVRVRLAVPVGPRPIGAAEMASQAFRAGGLGAHTQDQLQQIFASTSVRIGGPSMGADGIEFSASCLPEDLELTLQTLRAWLTDPAWRPEPVARTREAWIQGMEAALTDLDASVGRIFTNLATRGTSFRRELTIDEARAATLDQAREWLNPILAQAPLEAAIVGDIDLAEAEALAARYLFSLPEREAIRVLADPSEAMLPAPAMPTAELRETIDGVNRRSIMMIAWPGPDGRDVQRNRRLRVLGGVVSDQLRERIREGEGDAYSPGAWYSPSEHFLDFGYLGMFVGVAPERVEPVLGLLKEIAANVANNGVDADQLDRILTPMVRNLAAYRNQNAYWANMVALRSVSEPYRLDWASSMEADYSAISTDDLSALAAEILANDPLAVVVTCYGEEASAEQSAD